LVGKKRQKPSDGDKALSIAPKADLTVRKLIWWVEYQLCARVPCLKKLTN